MSQRIVDPKYRIWLDTWTLNQWAKDQIQRDKPYDILGTFDEFIRMEYQFVTSDPFVDFLWAQEEKNYFDCIALKGNLIIERWHKSLDDMVKKPFEWSSCSITTEAAESIEEAAKDLPNYSGIMGVKAIVEEYGVPRGGWREGPYSPPEPIPEELKKATGLKEAATRTEVLAACLVAKRMDLFNDFNKGYVRGLAIQHNCKYVLDMEGRARYIG